MADVAVTDFRYVSDLFLVRYKAGDGKLFHLLKPYTVTYKFEGNLTETTVPRGFNTDLASIPVIVPKWVAQKVANHLEAAVVHDFLYRTGAYTRELCDHIFLAAMEAAGVPWWRRQLMYRGVRLGGRASNRG